MTHEQLEAELDRLFQQHPADMVKVRNALADQLRKAGQKEQAAQVRNLPRPTSAAWALNRLHFEQPALLAEAQAAAESVRALHAEQDLDPATLRQAIAAQRQAVSAIVAAAERCCEAAKVPYGAAYQRKLLATVQGWLSGLGDEQPGRMTHDLEPGGFEGVQVVASAAPRVQAPPPLSKPSTLADTKRAQELAAAREHLQREQQQLEQAHENLRHRTAERGASDAAARDIDQRIRDAERMLTELRREQESAEATMAKRDRALAEAAAAHARAEEAVATARARLHELDGA